MNEHNEPLDPQSALGRFLSTIQNHADLNPEFRNSLLLAIGTPVLFQGEDDLTTIAPHVVASLKDELGFRAIYSKLTGPKVRTLLTKSKLATTADARGLDADQLQDLLWTRARNRAEERGLR